MHISVRDGCTRAELERAILRICFVNHAKICIPLASVSVFFHSMKKFHQFCDENKLIAKFDDQKDEATIREVIPNDWKKKGGSKNDDS